MAPLFDSVAGGFGSGPKWTRGRSHALVKGAENVAVSVFTRLSIQLNSLSTRVIFVFILVTLFSTDCSTSLLMHNICETYSSQFSSFIQNKHLALFFGFGCLS